MTGTEYTEREETPLGESRRKGQGNTPGAAYDSSYNPHQHGLYNQCSSMVVVSTPETKMATVFVK
jgi:hypothetical protein